jgi:hypothetical protein
MNEILERQAAEAAALADRLAGEVLSEEARLPARAAEAEVQRRQADEDAARVKKYFAQEPRLAAQLVDVGLSPALEHVHIARRAEEAADAELELAATEKELEHYAGLPPDLDAAREAARRRQLELARLQHLLQEGLEGLA